MGSITGRFSNVKMPAALYAAIGPWKPEKPSTRHDDSADPLTEYRAHIFATLILPEIIQRNNDVVLNSALFSVEDPNLGLVRDQQV